jgi:hypothetical protein
LPAYIKLWVGAPTLQKRRRRRRKVYSVHSFGSFGPWLVNPTAFGPVARQRSWGIARLFTSLPGMKEREEQEGLGSHPQ